MRQLLIPLLILFLVSCSANDTKYDIYWQDNNLCIVMPHPTMGLFEIGVPDWNGIDLTEVAEDIYKEIKDSHLSGEVFVWVRFENSQTDKYGNEIMSYDDHLIGLISLAEARKYKSGKYLNIEYHLTDNINTAAFGDINNIPRDNAFFTPVAPTSFEVSDSSPIIQLECDSCAIWSELEDL